MQTMPIVAQPLTPKYAIGAPVWDVDVDRSQRSHPCPDCLGSRTWTATSRAGETFTVNCLRCAQSYPNLPSNVPSLAYQTAIVSVRQLTVGSVRYDSHERDRSPWSYMCEETGVGSGRIYYENDLYPSEREATTAAEQKRSALQIELDSKPPNQLSAEVAQLTLNAAMPYAWNAELWHAWERYRTLRDVIEEMMGAERDSYEMGESAIDRIRGELEDRPWRGTQQVEALIIAAHAVLADTSDERLARLKAAVDGVMPKWLNPEQAVQL